MTPALHVFAADWIAAWNARDLERILSHYADDVVFESPVIRERLGRASGRVSGKAELRAYWSGAFRAYPDLRFELLDVLAGVDGGATRYFSHARGCEVVEVFSFDATGACRPGRGVLRGLTGRFERRGRMKSASIALAVLLAAAPLAAAPVRAAPAAAIPATDWRTPDPENVLVIETSKGRVIAELTSWAAPAHVERIKTLTRRGFYDGLTFFRVMEGFMAQTGDPLNTGMGGAEDLPDLKAEFTFRRGRGLAATTVGRLPPDLTTPSPTEIAYIGPMVVRGAPEMQMMIAADGRVQAWPLFCAGVLGMARGTDPDTGNSQFFLMRATYPSLDGQYTAFGRVLDGLAVVRAIKTGEPVAPPQDAMTRVRILADIPTAERPKVQVLDTTSASFKAMIKAAQARGGGAFTPCDLDIPVKIG